MGENSEKRKWVKKLNENPGTKFIIIEAGRVRGHPDVIGCIHGKTYVLELKYPPYDRNRVGHKLQLHQLKQWGLAGAYTGCLLYPEEWEEFLRQAEVESGKGLRANAK